MLKFPTLCNILCKLDTSAYKVSSLLFNNNMGKRNQSNITSSNKKEKISLKSKTKKRKPQVSYKPEPANTADAKIKVIKNMLKENELIVKPTRNKDGVFIFKDERKFCPNMSPKEVIQAGSFGGTYFRSIYSGVTKKHYGSEVWEELPKDWLEGVNIQRQVASPIYDINVNTYKVKCGSSLEAWESSNWIQAQDPYGWFQWYCRFFVGRRSEDDQRQIGRWLRCAGETGRWRNNLITKVYKAGVAYDNSGISPVVRQVLQHWAYKLTEKDYKARVARLNQATK